MSSQRENKVNLLPALLIVVGVVILVGVCGFFAFRPITDTIQGQADVNEYRVKASSSTKATRWPCSKPPTSRPSSHKPAPPKPRLPHKTVRP